MRSSMRFFIILIISLFLLSMVYAEDPVKFKVKVMQTKSNGKGWDAFGNPPDIFIKISHEKIGEISSRIFKDTHSARAVFYLDELSDKDEFTIQIWDKDIRNHDLIGEDIINKKNKTVRIGRCTVTIY